MNFVLITVYIVLFNLLAALFRAAFGLQRPSALLCGIYGFALKPGANREAAMMKLKILGIYNIPRGRDSCGVYVNGDIIKGVGERKVFDDLIELVELPIPTEEHSVVIGHNRNSTGGAHTEKNAHPFLINDRMVGLHNGKVTNWETLCREHQLDPKNFEVDSQALLTLLDNEGSEILEKYVGHAALAYVYLNEPNVLYLYHGSSKISKNGTDFEERPLCYVETNDGIFFSSLADSLRAIRDNPTQTVYILQTNEIVHIEDGEFTLRDVSINRGECNVTTHSTTSHVGKYQGPAKHSNIGRSSIRQDMVPMSTSVTNNPFPAVIYNKQNDSDVYKEPLIRKECLPKRVYDAKTKEPFVYYHNGRHWVYPRTLCEGMMSLKERGGAVSYMDRDMGVEMFYFRDGVMLKDREAYTHLNTLFIDTSSFLHNKKSRNYPALMSKFAKYPITSFDMESVDLSSYLKNAWWQNELRMDETTFTPKFSERSYIFNGPFLDNIKSSDKTDTFLFHKDYTEPTIEINILKDDKLNLVSGGGLISIPFRKNGCGAGDNAKQIDLFSFKRKWESDKAAKEQLPDQTREPEFFYEKVYLDVKEAYDDITEVELTALRDYIRRQQEGPIEANDADVEAQSVEIIITAINNKKSIIELCSSLEEINCLKDCYDKVLGSFDRSILNSDEFEEDSESPDDTSVTKEYLKGVKEVFNEIDDDIMRVEEIKDDLLSNVENINNIATELEGSSSEQGTDEENYCEDVAYVIRTNMGNMIDQLDKTTFAFRDSDFNEKVLKIKSKLPVKV